MVEYITLAIQFIKRQKPLFRKDRLGYVSAIVAAGAAIGSGTWFASAYLHRREIADVRKDLAQSASRKDEKHDRDLSQRDYEVRYRDNQIQQLQTENAKLVAELSRERKRVDSLEYIGRMTSALQAWQQNGAAAAPGPNRGEIYVDIRRPPANAIREPNYSILAPEHPGPMIILPPIQRQEQARNVGTITKPKLPGQQLPISDYEDEIRR